MTERLYYTDSYIREFEASVVHQEDDGRRVYLDRTAFYPTSGGQPFDLGRLGGSAVTDVVDEGERIAHVLDAPLSGRLVAGRLDWPRRFDHMQQHTGQHVLSAVIADLFGHATVSVHFGADASTLDLETGSITAEQSVEAERRANEVVTENRPVRVTFEDASEAIGLRKPSDRAGMLRIVTIDDLDRSACGGTHLRATGEIGPILIRRVERVKQLVRIEFFCGARAVRRARDEGDTLARLSALFSATLDELPTLAERQRAELKESAGERRKLEEQLSAYRAAELYESAAANSAGLRIVILREERGPADRLRPLGQAVARFPRAVFIGVVGEPPGVLLATAEDSGVDAGQALRTALGQVGGKGGGNSRLAQGTAPDPTALENVVRMVSG